LAFIESSEVSIIQERMPSNTFEIRHMPQQVATILLYISGEATMEVNGEIQNLQINQGIEIPPQTLHQMKMRIDRMLY